ncbi:glycosyl hydrolase family 61-domain-containing protein [Mycena vitilis]|nr:glycosyl hydrolase family 61-domain-containing protein [Mycena vitilis]
MRRLNTSLFLLILSVPYVAAHGFVQKLWIGDKMYLGTPTKGSGNKANPTSIIHRTSSQNPVKGAKNPSVNCGNNATMSAARNGSANPGDTMSFLWTADDLSTVLAGPMLTYMASCGSDCTTFNSSAARWFKIAEVGKISGSSGEWYQKRLRTPGVRSNVTLPGNIAPGAYIVRHEIIALHLANIKYNGSKSTGAEWYPSCAQVVIGGTGSGVPKDSELVSLPGNYTDSDPGIYVPDIYDTSSSKYTFPGPPIAALSGSGSGAGATPAKSTPAKFATMTIASSPTVSASSPSNPNSSGGGGTCKSKRAVSTAATTASNSKRALALARRRHNSRLIRRSFRKAHGL